MERTYISVNLQNLITVPLMAALGFLLVAVVYQVFLALTGGGERHEASNGGGF